MTTFILRHRGKILAQLESNEILDRYRLTHPNGDPLVSDAPSLAEDQVIEVQSIGEGSYGSVYRGEDPLGIPRALKFFTPEVFKIEEGSAKHEEEIRLTNQRVFKNVIRILDYGLRHDVRNSYYGVYVMDFIKGSSLSRFFREHIHSQAADIIDSVPALNALYRLLFNFLDQIVEGLRELHEADVVHMDIKPSNMLVPSPSSPNLFEWLGTTAKEPPVFITDLGAGKKITAGRSGGTDLVCTPLYFPMELLRDLGFQPEEGKVDYVKLRQYGSQVDLYSLARSIEELILNRLRRASLRNESYGINLDEAQESTKEALWREVLGPEFEILEIITDDLLRTKNGSIKTAADLQIKLAKISRREPGDSLTSEVLSDRYPGIRVRVSKHLVHIAKPLNQVVDHPAFQRLRNINQLTYLHRIFPGATHNRFAHSLLSFHLAKRYLLALNRNPVFRFHFDKSDIDTILVAALVHDIGQYPFAHSIEDLRKIGDRFGISYLKTVRYDEELLRTFLELPDKNGRTIRSIISEIGVGVGELETLVLKNTPAGLTSKQKIAREIVNGTIDVDRVSYLYYDSYMTGIPYGEGVDLESLIEALTIRWDEGRFASGLGIEEFGVSAAEMVLSAVYWMYRNVYWHHTNRGFMAAIKYVFNALLSSDAMSFDWYVQRTMMMNDNEALRLLSDLYDQSTQGRSNNFNPLAASIEGRRLGYSRVASFGHRDEQEGATYDKIIEHCDEDGIERIRRVVCDVLNRTYGKLDPEILVDIPLKSRLHKQTSGPTRDPNMSGGSAGTGVRLWVRRKRQRVGSDSQWQSIDSYSQLAEELGGEETREGRKIRIFLSDAILDSLPNRIGDRTKLERLVLDKVAEAARQWR